MSLPLIFDKIFDKQGNFINKNYDPHSFNINDPEQVAFHKMIFDEDGNLHEEMEYKIYDYIVKKNEKQCNFTHFSDCVHLYYAELASSATCQQYSTASMFKR